MINTIIIYLLICPLVAVLTTLVTMRLHRERWEREYSDTVILKLKDPLHFDLRPIESQVVSVDLSNCRNLESLICIPNSLVSIGPLPKDDE